MSIILVNKALDSGRWSCRLQGEEKLFILSRLMSKCPNQVFTQVHVGRSTSERSSWLCGILRWSTTSPGSSPSSPWRRWRLKTAGLSGRKEGKISISCVGGGETPAAPTGSNSPTLLTDSGGDSRSRDESLSFYREPDSRWPTRTWPQTSFTF